MCFARLFSLVIFLQATVAGAFEVEDRVLYEAQREATILRVISTADKEAFEPTFSL